MIERLGLSKTQVKTEVENKLKKLGVHVFKEAKPPAMSTLYVVINSLQTKSKATLIYFISVNLVEWAYLKRGIGLVGDLQEVHAINWYIGKIGYMPSNSIKMLMKPCRLILLRIFNITLGRIPLFSKWLKKKLVKDLIEKKEDRYVSSSKFFDINDLRK